MKIVLVLLTSLTFVVCSRIECIWGSEFLCGDKCLGLGNTCYCGNDNFTYKQGWDYVCCKEPNTTCEKNSNGGIQCEGQKLSPWSNKCHGSCSQSAKYGLTLLPCADQKECYLGTDACKGKPQCRE